MREQAADRTFRQQVAGDPTIVGDVSQPRRGLISSAFRYFDDHDVLGLAQERQRILHGTTGLAHVLPGDGDSPGWERRYARRHHQDRPAGLEDKAAGIESPKRIPARASSADDDEIGRRASRATTSA